MKKKFTLIFLAFVSLPIFGQGSWELIPDVPAANFWVRSISVVNAQTVWAIADTFTFQNPNPTTGNVPQVLRTTDGGATWQTHRVQLAADRFAWDIHGLDELTAIFTTNQFIGSDNRPIFKTSDGGLTWKKIVPPNFSGGVFVHFFNSKDGIVINRNSASTTVDGGETWSLVPAANFPAFANDEYNLLTTAGNYVGHYGDRLWIGTSKGRIIRSLDRGNHWQAFQVAAVTERIESIAFSDSLHGVALVTGTAIVDYSISQIYSTNDGGESWSLERPSPLGDAHIVAAVPNTNVFFFGSIYETNGEESYIARTNDISNALAWSKIVPDSVYMNCFDFLSPTVGFASGASDKVSDKVQIGNEIFTRNYFYKWSGNVLSNKELLRDVNLKISPSPTRDFLKIEFEGYNKEKAVKVSVSHITGEMIFSKKILGGRLDVSTLLSGLYFLKIETDGKQVSGKFLKY